MPEPITAADRGITVGADNVEDPSSRALALARLRDGHRDGLRAFAAVLGMRDPVTEDEALRLLEAVGKDALVEQPDAIADRMALYGWDRRLAPGEDLREIGKRAADWLATPEGLALFNALTRELATIDASMFEPESAGRKP